MLRLYSGRLLVTLDVCEGCRKILLRGDSIVLRSDGKLFCNVPCAVTDDDATLEPKAVAS